MSATPIQPGTVVMVDGLKSRADLNNQRGEVQGVQGGRVQVKMGTDGKVVSIQPSNLFKQVRLTGLAKRKDLDGKVATLVDEKEGDGRSLVELPDKTRIRVRSSSLIADHGGPVSWMRDGWHALRSLATSAQPMVPESPKVADYRMLLLGATGSGKTSFLNLLCNFNHVDDNGLADVSRFLAYHDMNLENSKNQMESQTSDASVYRTNFSDLCIEIVDTPGFGDTRATPGGGKEKEHTEKIIKTLKKVETLNCIAVIVSGADSRMNVFLEHVLMSIAGIMPANALPQLYVIYTHVDSLLKLTFKHDELLKRLNVKHVEFSVIDNPYSLLQNAKELQGQVPDDIIASELQASFQKARQQLQKFKAFLENTPPSPTKGFQVLYEKKCEIERATMNLVEDLKQCAKEEKDVLIMKDELQKHNNHKNVFSGYETKQIVKKWHCVTTHRHNTLCAFPECYKNCHLCCNLNFTTDKAVIKKCAAMDFGHSDTCGVCNHSYEHHYHNSAKWELKEETVKHVDAEMKDKYDKAKDEASQKQIALEALERRLTENRNKVAELKKRLVVVITEFEAMGSARNYQKLLASQINFLATHIEAKEGVPGFEEMVKAMTESKADLEKTLAAVIEAEKIESDPKFRKDWACKVMGLGPNPSEADIKSAYRVKAKEYHPDKPGGSEEIFKKLDRAKAILLA